MSSPRTFTNDNNNVKKSKLAEQKAELENFIKKIQAAPNHMAIIKKIGGDIEQLTTMIEKSNPETLTEDEFSLLISKVKSFISYNRTLLYFKLDNSAYVELFKIRQPLFATENINITPGCHMINVGTGEYAWADSNSNTLLYTWGAGPCVIVALYNEITKKSALIHFSSLEECQALDPILKLLGDTQHTRADLAGGRLMEDGFDPPAITLPSNLYRALIANKVTVRNTDLVHGERHLFNGSDCSQLILNSNNGGISDNLEDFFMINPSCIYDKASKIPETKPEILTVVSPLMSSVEPSAEKPSNAIESKSQPVTLPKKILPQVSIFSVHRAEDSGPEKTIKKSNFCVLL